MREKRVSRVKPVPSAAQGVFKKSAGNENRVSKANLKGKRPLARNKTIIESLEFLESIIDTVREPLIALDQDLRVVKVSRSFYDFFKVKPEETVGKLIYDLGNEQWNIPKLRELLETILPQKATFDDYEVEHKFDTIGRRTMLLNARQIQRAAGKERIILLAIEDVTERRKLEDVHNRLAAIVESAEDAIIVEDLGGRVLSWNKGAETAYGYKAGEIVGRSISLLMSSDHPDEYKEVLAKIAGGEIIKHYDTQRRRKDGQIIDVSLTISPVKDSSGKIVHASTIARDISERREIENGLEKVRKELEAANKELEAFTYSVSHDLRAPLRAIVGFSRILTDEHAAHLSPEVQRYLNLVLSNALQMSRLVDDLLSFSRFGRQAMAKSQVDPAVLVREAWDLLTSGQPERPLKMIVGGLPPCQGDRALLKQVFVNLLSNALKFTRQRDPAVIEVGSGRRDGETVYFVRDNGAGFDMRYVGKLFGVFQRLHRSEDFEGTGVGLAIVQRIVLRHGGRIWAEGEADKGATFFFTLGGISS